MQLTPLRLPAPQPGEVVFREPEKGAPMLARRTREDDRVVYRGRDGEVLHAYDTRLYGAVTHTYEERTVGDALISGPAREITLTDGGGATEVTADDGSHARSGTLDAWALHGRSQP